MEKQDMISLPQDEKQIPEDGSVSKRETKETEQAVGGGNIRRFKKLNRHQEILREWGRERVSLTVIPQTVTEAMQRCPIRSPRKKRGQMLSGRYFLQG